MSKIKDKFVSMPSWLLGAIYFFVIAYSSTSYFVPEEQRGLPLYAAIVMQALAPVVYFIFKDSLKVVGLVCYLASGFGIFLLSVVFSSLYEPADPLIIAFRLSLYVLVTGFGWSMIETFRRIHD